MLKDTPVRHCQSLQVSMENTEVCNFNERKDEFDQKEKLS